MNKLAETLPHWDVSQIYPDLESPEFKSGFQDTIQSITNLTALFDEHQINRVDSQAVHGDTVAVLEMIIDHFNQTLTAVTTIRAYIFSFIATDSRNAVAQAKLSELLPHMAKLNLLGTRLTAWVGSLDVEALIAQSTTAADHAYTLRKAKQDALHLMSPVEEDLSAELILTGLISWQKLYSTYSSQIQVKIELEGEVQILPLTAVQNLAYNRDRDIRARAYRAVLDTLADTAVPLAAALNAIKGETLALTKRRGWDSPLDMALFENGLDRPTLDAMMAACRHAFPDFQRYLKTRARALRLPVLAWYDQLVPLGQGTQSWSYKDATQFIINQFATYSPKMQQIAQRAFAEDWLDAEPRDGKSGGAFCMSILPGESRILMNFESGFTSVGTMAHELGHAYHNLNLAHRTPLQTETPMALAETASTFCQKIVENAALAKADAQDQMIIIDGLLEYATRVIVGASSNFLFEQRLFEKRAQRELSVEELCALDIETQLETRGDALDPDLLHPYRWAYVPHYYRATFYNYPYIFGLLFGLGLYAQYQANPAVFREGYDDLLSSTGMGNAADLAARFGIDIRQPAFWDTSLDILRADIDRFEKLIIDR
ncbi:MAG: M3 family oligoendopeptidase [Chloroflexi bacterium]|nr:M3 family oligoendopeptidase [Chloroflexota bacterium]